MVSFKQNQLLMPILQRRWSISPCHVPCAYNLFNGSILLLEYPCGFGMRGLVILLNRHLFGKSVRGRSGRDKPEEGRRGVERAGTELRVSLETDKERMVYKKHHERRINIPQGK